MEARHGSQPHNSWHGSIQSTWQSKAIVDVAEQDHCFLGALAHIAEHSPLPPLPGGPVTGCLGAALLAATSKGMPPAPTIAAIGDADVAAAAAAWPCCEDTKVSTRR